MSFLRLDGFLPTLLVPTETVPSSTLGFTFLTIMLYTLTFPSSSGLSLLRLALTPLAFYYFWDFGFGPYETPGASVDLGLAWVGTYGIMRVIDTSLIGFLHPEPPKWVRQGKPIPLPNTISGRIAYAVDYCGSMRGTSLFSGTHWDFIPRSLVHSQHPRERSAFLWSSLKSLLIQYLCFDALDTLNKSRTWDTTIPNPVTSLPFPYQLAYSISVCAGTVLAIGFPFTVVSIIAVALGSDPAGWPPMFYHPFNATTLADFWTKRWHALFRRTFDRLALGILWFIPAHVGERTKKATRAIVIFALSATLHLFLMYRPTPPPNTFRPPFLDPIILRFFLSQPFALLFESLIIIPLLEKVFPQNAKARTTITRIWAWAWLLWSGRLWADVWARRGFWRPEVRVVGWSIIRGLWRGEWAI